MMLMGNIDGNIMYWVFGGAVILRFVYSRVNPRIQMDDDGLEMAGQNQMGEPLASGVKPQLDDD